MIVIGKKAGKQLDSVGSWLDIHYQDCVFAIFPESGQTNVVIGDTPSLATICELTRRLEEHPGPYRLISARYAPRNFRAEARFDSVEALDAKLRKLCKRPTYFYHGTLSGRLVGIAGDGLRNDCNAGRAWNNIDPDLGEWCAGKLFLSPDIDNALSYAEQKATFSKSAEDTIVLRVRGDNLGELNHDPMGMGIGEVFVTHAINVDKVEFLVKGKWVPVSEAAEKLPVYSSPIP